MRKEGGGIEAHLFLEALDRVDAHKPRIRCYYSVRSESCQGAVIRRLLAIVWP